MMKKYFDWKVILIIAVAIIILTNLGGIIATIASFLSAVLMLVVKAIMIVATVVGTYALIKRVK